MKIVNAENKTEAINAAISSLKSGGLIIFPTETAYGVGVDANNPDAVSKLLEYKKRPEGKAISIAVSDINMASEYVDINSTASNIFKYFLPGPVTVVCESKHKADQRLESELGSLGIRIPNYKLILDLITEFGRPMTSTSANSSGKKTPYSIKDITDNLTEHQKSLIDVVIDAGELPKNPPSTVIDTTTDDLKVHREGRVDPSKYEIMNMFNSNSVEETIEIGESLMSELLNEYEDGPIVILLNGELGAGKTHLTKGLARAVKIPNMIKSPTYTYVSEYKPSNKMEPKLSKFYHFDAWRIQTKTDLEYLRFYDWFRGNNIIVMEWPSVAIALDEEFFKTIQYYYIEFVILDNDRREIKVFRKRAEA